MKKACETVSSSGRYQNIESSKHSLLQNNLTAHFAREGRNLITNLGFHISSNKLKQLKQLNQLKHCFL
jgi:hypothetical protein